jgi:hypothetical protein
MRPFSQLLLNLLVDLDVAFKTCHLLLQLRVLEQQLLGLLGLVLQLRSQLMILQHREPSRRLKLLLLERQQRCLRLLYTMQHVLLQHV